MSNPVSDQTAIVFRGSLIKDDNGYPTGCGSYSHVTTQTTTLVKTGAGFLFAIVFNKPIATGTVEYDDSLTNSNPMGIVTVPTSPQPFTLVVNAAFATGLSITTGVASQDLTIIYR